MNLTRCDHDEQEIVMTTQIVPLAGCNVACHTSTMGVKRVPCGTEYIETLYGRL